MPTKAPLSQVSKWVNPADLERLRAKTMVIYERLVAHYGERPLIPRRQPMHELISTMLSHRTTQSNEAIAYQRMMDRYGTWEAIRDAPVDELAKTIEPANFPEAKAPNIQATLRRIIDERGEANIDFLQAMPTDEAMIWLRSLPGVGIKTASLVLLFCFSKPVIPVDTHVHRVCQRTGLIGPKTTAEQAHHILLQLLPNDPYILFNFHIACLKHGQQICTWNNPRCLICPINDLCDYYQSLKQAG